MYVAQILRAKPMQTVATAEQEMSVAAAARKMTEQGVGSLVVLGRKGEIAGIVTERDILRRFARHGAELGAMTLGEIMTKPVETTHPDARIEELLERMTERRFRHLPVVEQGKLVGIVSIGDLVKALLQEKTAEAESLRQYITS